MEGYLCTKRTENKVKPPTRSTFTTFASQNVHNITDTVRILNMRDAKGREAIHQQRKKDAPRKERGTRFGFWYWLNVGRLFMFVHSVSNMSVTMYFNKYLNAGYKHDMYCPSKRSKATLDATMQNAFDVPRQEDAFLWFFCVNKKCYKCWTYLKSYLVFAYST